MSAPSDLEMIGNEDIEFARSSQRYTRFYSAKLLYNDVAFVKIITNFASVALFFSLDQLTAARCNDPVFSQAPPRYQPQKQLFHSAPVTDR